MDIKAAFNERLQEIEAYIELLEALERQMQIGPPKIGGKAITAQQQKILYSSVYLQLYNLVEATATWCIDAVAQAASTRWAPADLMESIRREWVRTTARTHVPLNFDNRLQTTFDFCELLLQGSPLGAWAVEKGGGGNWDDSQLEEITKRLGCELAISPTVKREAKRHIRDDKGSLGLVKLLRNKLAHGEMSFEECGDGVTVSDLKDIKDRTVNYLREVVASFSDYLDNYLFVRPERRPFLGTGI